MQTVSVPVLISRVSYFTHPRSKHAADRPIVPNKFSHVLCRQFGCRTSLCFTDQETQEENLQGGTSSLVGQFLHPISLVQRSRSIQRMQTVQLFLNIILILCRQFGCRTSLCFTDQETQEENLQGGTSSLVGQFLHPISLVQSSRSIQRMQTAQLFRNNFFILCRQFGCRTSLCFTDQETQEENLQGGTSSLVGQFLHPISLVQSARSIQRMQTAQLFRNNFFLFCVGNLDVGPDYA